MKAISYIVLTLLVSINMIAQEKEVATFGGGCFWCTEAFFDALEGVEKVESGYSGGQTDNPTYKEICSGITGHAEVVRITYNPQKVAFEDLLEVFFATHNPTTLNRQGADVGTQYRSVVFYHNKQQKQITDLVIEELGNQKVFDDPIVTEVTVFDKFYKAEDYHQDYFENNPRQPYCNAVINPKMEKFKKVFAEKLK
ncbi:peptide-methionine (S)-S-oxide reductase MsrA [Carboxylicivirga sp. M1479]|uniref:peptide-methionine (S)-S-oxide reductase MsrA n=1 Tax=uncultured Carboxylicivirga sp. TaxID=1628156 RepID=UPI0011787E4E|nr:peptide-methionine (S)-S-oxide reductase MsrA [Carboxylicivirga sp. M1479]TRX70780.1 peptide-methionine (S)-S-oxide reductase MsrA [Carboxylicivirga sp. M1479]